MLTTKDSIVFQYSFGKSVNVNSYDRFGRLAYKESDELEDDGKHYSLTLNTKKWEVVSRFVTDL